MTILYVSIQTTLNDPSEMADTKKQLGKSAAGAALTALTC
jgi:hypothetical protein